MSSGRCKVIILDFVGPAAVTARQHRAGLLDRERHDMSTDTGQVVRLEDYRPSDYLIPETKLTFASRPTDAGDGGADDQAARQTRETTRRWCWMAMG